MADWIKSYQTLARHPKLIRLSSTLRVNKAQAIGHLHLLWWWTLDYAPTGDVSAFSSYELGAAVEWKGDAEQFVKALRETGWIDEDGTIHDWHEYAGQLLERREADRERKRVRRMSDGRPQDVQRMSGVEKSRVEESREEESTLRAFDAFWETWPKHHRKVDRRRCEAKWKASELDAKAEEIVAHVNACKASADWQKNDGQFIPAPLVYLNQQKYEAPAPPKAKGTQNEYAIPEREVDDELVKAAFEGAA